MGTGCLADLCARACWLVCVQKVDECRFLAHTACLPARSLPILQNIFERLKEHRLPSKFGKQLVMWYMLLPPSVDRKEAEGRLIKAMEKAGLPMSSTRDASKAKKK
jgi:hypothetical protein